jgi:aspartate aminotransferase/aminotransferase
MDDIKKLLAQRTNVIDASGIRKVFALGASLKDPINFSIGQPDFDVPEPLKQKAIEAIQAGQNSYSQTTGDEQLREKATQKVKQEIGWSNPSTIITSGVSGGLLLSLMALVNPGDEVVIPDPYFVMYKHLVNLLGGKPVYVDTYPDFRIHADRIEEKITDKTKLILLNSPSNPTGIVFSEDEVKSLAETARKHNVLVISDEIYDTFCYDSEYTSIAEHYEKTLVLKGFSKSHAMTGWRLGYAAAPEKLAGLIDQIAILQQYTFVCAPSPFQKAAVAALDYDVSEFVDNYRKKRDMIYDGLKDKFELAKPQGAFYAFVKAPGGKATEFVKKAIDNNMLIIPGGVFSERNTHFRISYAAPVEKIRQGIEKLNSLA